MIPLFVPGPATVAGPVLAAQAQPVMYHRSVEYGVALTEIASMLGEVLGTTREVHCVNNSGTGTIEMALVNLCRHRDQVVVASNGYFGERLAEICRRVGLDVFHINGSWTEPLPLEDIERALPGAVALVAVHHETSTGHVNDLSALAEISDRNGALFLVDAISSAGTLPINMDDIGIDVVVATSQKGVGGTPGIGILAGSTKVWKRLEALAPPPTLAADWLRVRRAFQRDPAESQWTPPVSVMAGLHMALIESTRRTSIQDTWDHRAAIGRAVRAGLHALGFTTLPAGSVDVAPITVAEPPGDADATALIRSLTTTGIHVGPGQGPFADRVIRVSHLGAQLFHVFGLLGAIEVALAEGASDRNGSWAVQAALAHSQVSATTRLPVGVP